MKNLILLSLIFTMAKYVMGTEICGIQVVDGVCLESSAWSGCERIRLKFYIEPSNSIVPIEVLVSEDSDEDVQSYYYKPSNLREKFNKYACFVGELIEVNGVKKFIPVRKTK